MRKPIPPKRKIPIVCVETFGFPSMDKKVSIEYFLSWLKKTTPINAKNVSLALIEEPSYDYEGNLLTTYSYIELNWEEIRINEDYDKDMKKYEKKLRKYNKKEIQS